MTGVRNSNQNQACLRNTLNKTAHGLGLLLILELGLVGCVWFLPVAAVAQIARLGAQELAELRQNPDLIRQRIRQSGMTADQIRATLRAAGYPENLLDPYLVAGGQSDLPPSEAQLSAIELLGLPFALSRSTLPPDTGLVISRAPRERSRVFGVDAFRRSTTEFLPLVSGPVPPDYRLGPGDVLVLLLSGSVEVSHTLMVSREGFVIIPRVGQLFVANLTLDQLRDLLYDRLGRVYSGVRRGPQATTRFDLSVVNVRTVQVYVTGEVVQPGAYQISALGTVMTALYAAGGVTERANLRSVQVRRMSGRREQLDLYDYLLHGDASRDPRLESGDIIFVPVQGPRVEITGAVVRPAIYELGEGEGLADLVRAAGGLRPNALKRRITIHRILPAQERVGPAQRVALDVELGTWGGAAPDGFSSDVVVPDVKLLDGDSVVVDSIPALEGTYHVTIGGQVLKPGSYPWRPGMTLRDLVRLAQGPAVGADLRQAEIARLPKDRLAGVLATTFLVPMDSSYLLEADSSGRYPGPPGLDFSPAGTAPEVVLQPFDQVTIFKQPEFELQKTVFVGGEVQRPGPYALTSKQERLSDLVKRAGGLLPSAFVQGAQLYRVRPGLVERGISTLQYSVPPTESSRVRMDIELDRALRTPGGWWDVILLSGDSLYVPEYSAVVEVTGAVNSPSLVQYRPGAGLEYYIASAGGYARNADKGRIHVRYANGSARVKSKFLIFSSEPKPGPGSIITVPAKPQGEPFNPTEFFASLAQIAASVVAIIAIATR